MLKCSLFGEWVVHVWIFKDTSQDDVKLDHEYLHEHALRLTSIIYKVTHKCVAQKSSFSITFWKYTLLKPVHYPGCICLLHRA